MKTTLKGFLTLPMALSVTSLGAAPSLAQVPSLPGVTSTSGQVTLINPPPSVLNDPTAGGIQPLEADNTAFLFLEQENFVLPSDIPLDVTVPAAYNITNPTPTPGTATTGTTVNSYYLNSNPIGKPAPFSANEKTYIGSITFDNPILGLAYQIGTIASGNGLLGNPTTLYLPGTDPGLGVNFSFTFKNGTVVARDAFTLTDDRKTLTFNFTTASGVDQLRIITLGATQTVPEPRTILGSATATALGFAVLFKRKRAKKSQK